MNRLTLYCLPYAGGAAAWYQPWQQFAGSSLRIQPLEYPGRGSRMKDQPYQDIPEAVSDLCTRIEDEIRDREYAFFGHSMGGIIAFEMTRALEKKGLKPPRHLFISAVLPSNVYRERGLRHYQHMDHETLWNAMVALGGIAPEIRNDLAIRNYYLPLIRNDLRIFENHTGQTIEKIQTPVSVLTGDEDPETDSRVSQWASLTSGKCRQQIFPGGHFYPGECTRDVVQYIQAALHLR